MGALILVCFASLAAGDQPVWPGPIEGGYYLPNGWRITPLGKSIPTEDLILNIQASPDGKVMIAEHGGYNPHGLVVIDAQTDEAVQRIPLPSSWYGLAWRPDGTRLYVSGGNDRSEGVRAPVYEFEYKDGRLSEKPLRNLMETIDPKSIGRVWHHPQRTSCSPRAARRQHCGFNTDWANRQARIGEQTPCDVVLSRTAAVCIAPTGRATASA